MEVKRVVVTGIGAITPIGNSKEEYIAGLANGVSGADTIRFPTTTIDLLVFDLGYGDNFHF